MGKTMNDVEYAGFWVRTGASLIDTIWIVMITAPVLTLIYGKAYWSSDEGFHGFWDLIFNYVLPAIAVIAFWIYKSATPGKMILGLKIVDADTGEQPSTGRLVGRYFAYYLSGIALCLGFIWVVFDERKQGWHDKLANTVVIRSQKSTP